MKFDKFMLMWGQISLSLLAGVLVYPQANLTNTLLFLIMLMIYSKE